MVRATLTVTEAAEVLGVGRNFAYELARVGKLPTIRLGRKVLVPRAALEKMLAGAGTGVVAQAQAGRGVGE
ncbi:MAG: DNA-binding protein [Dehalococcoidia bacterium]|nr:DNA-binding protein [Dehalococcoidia bacterium]